MTHLVNGVTADADRTTKGASPFSRTIALGRDSLAARVRDGSASATPRGVFTTLAADPDVTVRAAVAMNPATPPSVDAKLAEDADERVRVLLARKLAALIPTLSDAARDRLRARVMTTLGVLVQDEAVRVRAAIADVVKEMPEAPRELILKLAYDSEVLASEPVVRLSPLLTTGDLLSLLTRGPAPGTAVAIARREGLNEAVSDAIAQGDDPDAVTALLENASAAVREATIDLLAEQSAGHLAWQAPLVHRPILSTRAARALAGIVASQLLASLASRADLDPSLSHLLRERIEAASSREARTEGLEPGLTEALVRARASAAAQELDESTFLAAARRGDETAAVAILSVSADVSPSAVEKAATLRSAKGLVSLVWAAGFSMRSGVAAQTLLAGIGPDAMLTATGLGDFPLATDEMRWTLDFLRRG